MAERVLSDAAPSPQRRRGAGIAASALAAVFWGLAGLLANLTSVSGLVLTFYRMWIGAAVLTTVTLLCGRRVTWLLLRRCAPAGVCLAADMIMFFSAVKMTSVAVATVIGALQPALVLLTARRWLGERTDRRGVALTAVAIAGVAVIVAGGGVPGGRAGAGDLLAVGALVAFTGYFLAAKTGRRAVDALDFTAGATIVAAATTTLVVLVVRPPLARLHPHDLVLFAVLAVVPGSAHVLMNWAHRYLDVSVSSVIGSATPLVAAGASWIWLGQRLGPTQVVGGLTGLAAITAVAWRSGTAGMADDG